MVPERLKQRLWLGARVMQLRKPDPISLRFPCRYLAGDTTRQLFLGVWADFNRDQQWTPDEQLFGTFIGGPGVGGWDADAASNTVDVEFDSAPGGPGMWMRFRLAYGEAVGPTGPTEFGEVEDYLLTPVPEPTPFVMAFAGILPLLWRVRGTLANHGRYSGV
jgi:hypothetical protein